VADAPTVALVQVDHSLLHLRNSRSKSITKLAFLCLSTHPHRPRSTRPASSHVTNMATKYAFANGLKELRFHLCQTSDHSAAARYVATTSASTDNNAHLCSSQFLLRTYPTMKKHNPHTPIMIREALDVQPKVWARYGQYPSWGCMAIHPLTIAL
jgi:hypothetical protein